MRVRSERCDVCGRHLREYPLYDRETERATGEVEVVCPDDWRESHQ